MATPLKLDIVTPDALVWSGEAIGIIVRTTEGDLGILANHEPVMAALAPHGAEITKLDGTREIVAVEGGFVSVVDNEVSLLSDYAALATELDLTLARNSLAEVEAGMVDGGTFEQQATRDRYLARVRAAEKHAELGL